MNTQLVVLGSDWYWEQDALHRFTLIRTPEAGGRAPGPMAIGRARWELESAQALTMTWEEHRALLSARLPFHDFQYVHRAVNGAPRYLSASGEPMFDADGHFVGYRGTTRDITDHWVRREELQDANALLGVAAVLGRFGAWSVDVGTGHLQWTEQARALYELPVTHDASVHATIGVYAPESHGPLMEAYERCVLEGAPFDLELQAVTPSGRRLWVRVIGVAVRDHTGRVVRVQGAVQDIDASKTAAEAHRRQLLLHAQELEERVRERTEELRRTNEELSAFTLAVAHDLGAPLAGIGGFASAAAARAAATSDPKLAHYLQRIVASAARMEDLLAGLLALSRIGRAELVRERVDLSAIARDTAESLRAAHPGRRAIVRVQEGMAAIADRRLVRTLVENLVGNAWKFSAARDPAHITIGQEDDGAFFVRDDGAGFDMAHAQELFAPFRRLHDPDSFQGLGVGLASARRVVERHGGRIWATSAPDQGAVFRFTLAPPPQPRG